MTQMIRPGVQAEDEPPQFKNIVINSVFQPIYSLSHRRAVGYEALVRGHRLSGEPVSPLTLFDPAQTLADLLSLDALCQSRHIHSFARQAPKDRWLFLNINAASLANRSYQQGFINAALSNAHLSSHHVVIEILEGAIAEERVLRDAVAHFRALGALVALDDFGTGHSNFHRIWRVAPDIIKLDRSIIEEAAQHETGRLRHTLPNLVKLMHEAGSLVLVEGVENETQALVALDADVDFVQGYYFGRPAAHIIESHATVNELDRITDRLACSRSDRDRAERKALQPYIEAFRTAARLIDEGRDVDCATRKLLAMPLTARCYLLNARGEQLVHLPAKAATQEPDDRNAPIVDTSGGTWFRRPYFRSAINDPRRLKVSQPYLSSTGAHMCRTLSISTGTSPLKVFCCDVHC